MVTKADKLWKLLNFVGCSIYFYVLVGVCAKFLFVTRHCAFIVIA